MRPVWGRGAANVTGRAARARSGWYIMMVEVFIIALNNGAFEGRGVLVMVLGDSKYVLIVVECSER